MRYQPVLYELPKKVGDMPAGTILCSGSSIPRDMASTELLLFKSNDGAKTRQYVSSVIKGGRARYEVRGTLGTWLKKENWW